MPYICNLPMDSQLTIEEQTVLYSRGPFALIYSYAKSSLVSLQRHIGSINKNEKSKLITSSITVSQIFKQFCSEYSEAYKNIHTAYEFFDKFDGEIIIDGAQNIPEHILQRLKSNSERVSLIIYKTSFQNRRDDYSTYILDFIFPNIERNYCNNLYRHTYSKMNFIRNLFPDRAISKDLIDELRWFNEGEKPILLKYSANNKEEQIKKETEILKELLSDIYSSQTNIAILVPFEKDVEIYFNIVKYIVPYCSKYHQGMDFIDIVENIHISTFQSIEGVEFDYIIIPNFCNYERLVYENRLISKYEYITAISSSDKELFLLSNNNLPIPINTYYLKMIN